MATRILWSGLTGRTGVEAMRIANQASDLRIVFGVSRKDLLGCDVEIDGVDFRGVNWKQYGATYRDRLDYIEVESNADVFVDFSNAEVFDEILSLAIRTNKPVVSGTSGLSNRQMAKLYDATNRIPVFRGGNFRFKVKKFIDEAVKLAMTTNGGLTLYENFYEGKSLPSETSKVVQRRISEATGKTIGVSSTATLSSERHGQYLGCYYTLS